MRRERLFDIELDAIGMEQALRRVRGWIAAPERQARYVVTPNVNHVVLLQRNPALRRAYADADLVLVDGKPLVWLSRAAGRPLPERVAGSDFTERLLGSDWPRGLSVFLMGGAPGVAATAAERMVERWPGIRIAGIDSPPFGFDRDPAECRRMAERVAAAAPDLLIVGLGAPRQEIWAASQCGHIGAKAVLCVGAAIDFLAGGKARAPHWMREAGLEWLHRACSEPRRLGPRYLRDGYRFAALAWRELRRGETGDGRTSP